MTDHELDKECELLKQYIKYYVDCLADNAMSYLFHIRINQSRQYRPEEIIRLFEQTGIMVLNSKELEYQEYPVSFDLWKKTVQV